MNVVELLIFLLDRGLSLRQKEPYNYIWYGDIMEKKNWRLECSLMEPIFSGIVFLMKKNLVASSLNKIADDRQFISVRGKTPVAQTVNKFDIRLSLSGSR